MFTIIDNPKEFFEILSDNGKLICYDFRLDHNGSYGSGFWLYAYKYEGSLFVCELKSESILIKKVDY
jgi:hypothetical protein